MEDRILSEDLSKYYKFDKKNCKHFICKIEKEKLKKVFEKINKLKEILYGI